MKAPKFIPTGIRCPRSESRINPGLLQESDFDASWKALKATDYYGTPGDGIIPDEPDLKEPTKLDLPDLGDGQAGIERSLATKIVEVVPRGATPIGKDIL